MNHHFIVQQLAKNQNVLKAQLECKTQSEVMFKPAPDKWCMLEVLCHLVDEEKEDFRTRVEYVLRDPTATLPDFDPTLWPEKRNYLSQDFDQKLTEFVVEREKSIEWLENLIEPKWNNVNHHPEVGPRTAEFFLANWLAHDYIHIRQLNRLAFEFLESDSGADLSYAGKF